MDVQRSAPPAPRRTDGRMIAGAALILLVLVVAALAARGGSWTARAPVSAPATHTSVEAPPVRAAPVPTTPASPSPLHRSSPPLPPWQLPTAVLVGLVAVLGIALLTWVVRHVRLPRWHAWRPVRPAGPAADQGAPDRRPLAEAAGRALAEVEQPDAREAVIRSWLLLGEAAAEAGVPLRPAETATEYASRIAAEFYVPVPMLTRLAELYREARFSRHEVGGEQRAEARNLLAGLSADLEHGRR